MEYKDSSLQYLKDFTVEVEDFDKFIATFDHLPKDINKVLLLRYLKTCDFDREKAKELLETNLRFRQKHPHLFSDRDVFSSILQKASKTYQINHISKFTKDNLHVSISRFADLKVDNFEPLHVAQWLFLSTDAGLSSDRHGIADGEIIILDFKGFTWAHFLKVMANFGVMRAFLKYLQGTVPYIVVQNHYINCSSAVTKLMPILRPFICRRVLENMHFHTDNYETLYEFVPREFLPTEYGGTFGTFDEIFETFLRETYEMSDYVKHSKDWTKA